MNVTKKTIYRNLYKRMRCLDMEATFAKDTFGLWYHMFSFVWAKLEPRTTIRRHKTRPTVFVKRQAPVLPVLPVRSSCLVFPVRSLRLVVFLVCPACLLHPVVPVLPSWVLVRLVVCVSCVSPVHPGLSCRSSVSMCPSRPVCPVRQVCPVKPELSDCGA